MYQYRIELEHRSISFQYVATARTFRFGDTTATRLRLELEKRRHGVLDLLRVRLSLVFIGLDRCHRSAYPAEARRRLPPLDRLLATQGLVQAVITHANGIKRCGAAR